jgi:O-antigen/teichoic acid export membrane protein
MVSSKTVAMAAGFLTASLINRSLGPSGRGIYAEMQTWMGLFAVIFGMSMDTAIYHFANKSLYEADEKSKFFTTFLLSMIYGLLASAALAIFVYGWPEQVSSETSQHIFLLNILLVATILIGNLTIFLQAIGDIKYSAIIGLVQGLTSVLVIGYAYRADLIDIKLVLISLLIVQAVTLLMLLDKFTKYNFLRGRFSKNLAKGIIAAGLKQHVATIATFVYIKINQLIIFRYCGESETGIFAVPLSAALYLMFIPMTFQTVLYPRVIHATDDYEITIRSLRLGFYIWGVIILLMILFAKPILLLYAGKDFLPAISTFRILLITTWLLPLSSLVAPYCIKLGAFYAMSFSALLLGVISIVLNMLLIPSFLKIGAALATSITSLTGFCFSLILLRFLSKKNPLEFVKVRIPV